MKPTITLIAFLFCVTLAAQRIVFPGQDLLYPNLNDPSFVGEEKRVEVTGLLQVSDVARKQTSQYIFVQIPIYENMAFGIDYFKDRFDYFSYSAAMVSTAFTIGDKHHFLKLGVSGGIDTRQQDRIPLDQLPTDESFAPDINASNRAFTYRGGLHYTLRNLTLGGFYNKMPIQRVTLRNGLEDLLEYQVEEGFTAYAQYGIKAGTGFMVTPIFRYLSYDDEGIYEGALRVDFKDLVSASVSYKNEYSVNPALQVFLFNSLHLGYSYEMALGDDAFGDVHALSLSYKFKKREGEEGPEWEENAKETTQKIAAIKEPKKKKEPKKEAITKPIEKTEAPETTAMLPESVEEIVAPKTTTPAPKETVAVAKTPEVKEETIKRPKAIDKTVDENTRLLKSGYYVIIGSFASLAEAQNAQKRFTKMEYYTIIGRKDPNSRFYLIVDSDTTKSEAIKRLSAHKLDRNFKEPWLMTVK